jgi:hypothetical protein
MHDEWTDQLSDYVDDELPADERRALERHLAGCPECARTLQDLKRIVATASSLPARPPAADLWNGVAVRVGAPAIRAATPGRRAGGRRIAFTMPQLAAAGLLLATISGAVGALMMTRTTGAPAARTAGVTDETSQTPLASADADAAGPDLVQAVGFADVQYDAAVVDFERALEEGRGRLDEKTVSVVEQNLSIIDRAIAEARGALVSDPSNSYLSGHLVETRRRKLALLRRAAALMTEAN